MRSEDDRHDLLMAMATDPEFQAECDLAYRQGQALEEAERAERIRLAEESAEQRDWESDEETPMAGRDFDIDGQPW